MEKGKRKKFRRVSWESLITTLDFARIIRNGRRGGGKNAMAFRSPSGRGT